MALPTWPESLPQVPLIQGSSPASLYPEPAATQHDVGPTRRRRRSLTNTAVVNHRYKMTNGQFRTFQAFARDTLNHGVRRFTMPIWKAGATLPLPIKVCALHSLPAIEMHGPYNYVTVQVEVEDY